MNERSTQNRERGLVAGAALGVAVLAGAGWLLGRGLLRGAAPADPPAAQAKAPPETVEAIRPRLAYEGKRPREAPKLSKGTEQHLSHLERVLNQERRAVGRAMVLRALH